MSALLVDDLVVPVPVRPQPGRWRHVERGPQARPQVVSLPGGRPEGVPAPELRATAPAAKAAARPIAPRGDSWQLTDRGIAVVVVFFLAVVATAAVVLVTSFLSVSNAPLPAAPNAPIAAAANG